MPHHHTVLSIAALKMPALGRRAATTLLVGAALLRIQHRFGAPAFDLKVHASLVGDNPADTMRWLANELPGQGALLLWRAEDVVVPALVSAASTAVDTTVAAAMLRSLDRALEDEVIDVAVPYGGALATSFDRVAHGHGLPFVPMHRDALAEAHATFNYGAVHDHLRTRAVATWQLHLTNVEDNSVLRDATIRWITNEPVGVEAR